jgi:GlpG protein
MGRLEAVPMWKGVVHEWKSSRQTAGQEVSTPPLFEQIRQGQYWRLFTPCLMHRDFLHILFNLAWVWILGRQIDERLRPWRVIPLLLIIGIVSNVAQYLMSGPFFMGYSGIVVGMAGFIWMRQRVAPWEGYPLSRSTCLFLMIFVLSMLALEWITLGIEWFSAISLMPAIANTAHVIGGLTGMLLGRFSCFGRSLK